MGEQLNSTSIVRATIQIIEDGSSNPRKGDTPGFFRGNNDKRIIDNTAAQRHYIIKIAQLLRAPTVGTHSREWINHTHGEKTVSLGVPNDYWQEY